MKGLFVKDCILIKKYCIFHILISIMFFIMSILGSSNIFFRFYSVVMLSIIPITISAYDEQCKWSAYEAALPISRKQVVLEKYIVELIMAVPSTLIYSAILLVLGKENTAEVLSSAPLMLLCGILPSSIVLPIIFKFGYLKGRIINFIIIAIAAMISIIFSGYISTDENLKILNTTFGITAFAAAVVIFTISLVISTVVYRKKEF